MEEWNAQCKDHTNVHITCKILLLNNEDVNLRPGMSRVIYDLPSENKASYKEVLNKWWSSNQSDLHTYIVVVGQAEIGKTQILVNLLADLKKQNCFQYWIQNILYFTQ